MEEKKIMDLLFEGQIYPSEDIAPRTAEYRKLNRKVEALCGKLSAKLSSEDYELIEELCSQKAIIENILSREYFKYGLSLGLRLMQESEALCHIRQRRNLPDD